MAVQVDERGGVLGKSHFLDAPDEDAVGSEMRGRLRRAKEICLGIGEIRQAAPEPPIALLEPPLSLPPNAWDICTSRIRAAVQGGLTGPARETPASSRRCNRDDTATPSTYMQTSRAAGP